MLDCKVQGNPPPRITWLKDEVEIEITGRYQTAKHANGICELQIHCPNMKDSGTYTCMAENSSGMRKITHRVLYEHPETVRMEILPKDDAPKRVAKGKKGKKDKPIGTGIPKAKASLVFGSYLTNRTVPEGKPVKLSCFVSGPEPLAKWAKNGGTVAPSPTCKLTNVDGLLTLALLNPTCEDSGNYTVSVKNAAGTITSTCLLDVYSSKITADFPPMFTRALKGKFTSSDLSPGT